MTHYKTIDGKIYKVYPGTSGKPAKNVMFAQCIKSTTAVGEQQPFILQPGQVEKNIRHGTWTEVAEGSC